MVSPPRSDRADKRLRASPENHLFYRTITAATDAGNAIIVAEDHRITASADRCRARYNNSAVTQISRCNTLTINNLRHKNHYSDQDHFRARTMDHGPEGN